MSSISTANCLRLHDVSLKYGLYEMKNKIDRFLEWNFKNLAKEADFLKLSAGQLADIVQSENLRVRKEEVVYEAVMKWFKHDPGHRRENAEKVFQEVRFCQIPKRYLLKQVVPELVEGEKMCKDLVDGAISHQDDPKKTPGNPRKPLEAIYVISRKDNMAERYDPVQCACVPCYPLVPLEDDEEVEYRCAVVIGSDIYAVFASRVERFDPIGICWQEVGSGLDVRDAGICASKDTIYVVGGRLQGNGLQKYTIKQSTWSVGPEMNESRRLPGKELDSEDSFGYDTKVLPCIIPIPRVTFLNNKVYVFGGYGSKGPLASAECYNVKQDKWSSIRGMRIPRFQLAATVHGGLIYVLGGRDNDADLSSVEVYDPKAKTWSKEELNMLEARNDFGVVEQNGRIYCFGGRGVATVECFDVEKKEWKTIGNTGHNNFAIDCVLFPPI
ncbi:predicted protein [Nematostella vectensis]|uniref:BACK domain-containing protein n=1 Tax=Nematostella vectensis TaxID=45351 RepID=A7SQW9_NEMVE|nr:predicted protein [Nematostella vectensis]|eukprot:XP_001626030.1 predicted protein [Nematostella vectensis]